ncbi:MAG: ATP-dependent 6-phosphofructokinase [Actinobacteria bacterium]|uniref:6-phosphofructokinase n=1 Tax=freshwater metagenome TaxID=449393 RepID=A0A6J7PLW4_9ZZZZ|nr:ATP-dependent 6-phosphofructokinase [Actinomycetota bacterium]MSW77256.1 ATP-dependent 6-phosphofructokinase [Actinomycetota bacterium]MSX54653.1 ATP-dependent 6-phosphofructokinase [Actinomycetota bacterium]MSX92506.1 ATP-dependent 6-phosphofructokinase [Actinomycetota bacterium]MSZ83659.1 ATP-dependent 6-phosphofructokinase [Actinomycetota bacterium]
MSQPIRRIALSTGGGDAPGLNAVIRAATLAAVNRGWEVLGIRDGFNGLMNPEEYPQGGVVRLGREEVRGIVHLGGTILGTTNKGNPTAYPVRQPDGSWIEIDRTPELLGMFRAHSIDALITIGGDGSLTIGDHLQRAGMRVIGVPKTIDNDLERTEATFGFDTAVEFASECIDRLFSTATSHGRVIVVEVMGRHAGWIALHAGVACGAHAILIPEIPYVLEHVAETIREREERGAKFSIVVVAEGAAPVGGSASLLSPEVGHAERLGGVGEKVAGQLQQLTGKEARTVVLGHLLRGGTPTAFDRLLGLRFGAAAVRALEAGMDGVMVALNANDMTYVPLATVSQRQRTVPLGCDTMLTARDMAISFGDGMSR